MKLFTPDGTEIVSILLENGTTTEFEFHGSIKNGGGSTIYKVPEGTTSKITKSNGEYTLVDANGKHWSASDIEYENAGKFYNH